MNIFHKPYRISGIAGLLFVGLSTITSGINVQPPTCVQDGATLVAWFADNGTRFWFGYFIVALAFLPFFTGFQS